MVSKKDLEKIVEQWEETKNSYFWKFGGNAQQRNRQAKKYEFDYRFTKNGKRYHVFRTVDSSRNNVYVTSRVMVDGEQKTIKAIKDLLK